MTVTVKNGMRRGKVVPPASKSEAHRALICAALSERASEIICDGVSADIEATAACLNALGGEVVEKNGVITVKPGAPKGGVTLRCKESGSTLRFLLPVVGALGVGAVFETEGRLSERPLEPLASLLVSHGMEISRQGSMISCSGRLTAGKYEIRGDVSSQYISGLLFALPLLNGDSVLTVTGNIESRDYITMTENAVSASEIAFEKRDNVYSVAGGQRYRFPERSTVGRDWSSAAFFLCMGAASDGGITLSGLSEDSAQGDRAILEILGRFGAGTEKNADGIRVFRRGGLEGITLDASGVPDLVPAISAVAAAASGRTVIKNAGRLRLKESDRLKTTRAMLASLGADIKETEDGLEIYGKDRLSGGVTDSYKDHRIAMSAAVAASVCKAPVTVRGAECVEKSYPAFWNDLNSLEVL